MRVAPRLGPRRRRAGASLTPTDMLRFLHFVAEGVGFDTACLSAGLNRGDVLLARARNPRLAELWDQVGEARRAAMESMLLDRGEVALRAPPVKTPDGGLGLDKPTAGMLQWALGTARAPRPVRAEPKPPAVAAASAPVAPAPLSEAEVDACMAEALARLAAAEAALADAAVETGPRDLPAADGPAASLRP